MTYFELMTAYLESLKDRASYERTFRTASQWILTREATPTRQQLIARMQEKGIGDCQPGCQQANKELAIQRAAFRWGLYHEVWDGGDPTVGIRKFKTKTRKKIAKFLEVKALIDFFSFAKTDTEIRDRALFGVCLLTGCRPSEIRTAPISAITPYGRGGCWDKGETKTGEEQEIPLPAQAMRWVHEWLMVRSANPRYENSPWLFPGLDPRDTLSDEAMRKNWEQIREALRLDGLWNYDLRRTLASYLSNELGQSDKRVQAILNHHDGRALSHYCHVSFDAMMDTLQAYEDWILGLTAHATGKTRRSTRTLQEVTL